MIKKALLQHYNKERKDRILQFVVGLAMAIGGWVLLYFFKGYFWFGLSLPLLLFSAVMLARAVKNYFLASRRSSAVADLDEDAAAVFTSMDLQRLKRLPLKYRRNMLALFILIFIGGAFLIGGWFLDRLFSIGVGVGMIAHAFLLIGFEMIFVYRSRTGTRRLEQLMEK